MATIDTSWKPVATPDLGGAAFLGYSSKLIDNSTSLLDNLIKQRQADAKLEYDKENDALNRALKGYEVDSTNDLEQKKLDENIRQFGLTQAIKEREVNAKETEAKAALWKAMHGSAFTPYEKAMLTAVGNQNKLDAKERELAVKEQGDALDAYEKNYLAVTKDEANQKFIGDSAFLKNLATNAAGKGGDPALAKELTNIYYYSLAQGDTATSTEIRRLLANKGLFGYESYFGHGYDNWQKNEVPRFLRDNAINIAKLKGFQRMFYEGRTHRLNGTLSYYTKSRKEALINDEIKKAAEGLIRATDITLADKEAIKKKFIQSGYGSQWEAAEAKVSNQNTVSNTSNEDKSDTFEARQAQETDNGHKSK